MPKKEQDLTSNMTRTILRSEPFGGIVADRLSSKVRFYNHTAFSLIEHIIFGSSGEQILNYMKNRFKGTDNQSVNEHINICREDILTFINYDDYYQ